MTLYQLKITATTTLPTRPRHVWFGAASLEDADRIAHALAKAFAEVDRVQVTLHFADPTYARYHLQQEGRKHVAAANATGQHCLDPWLLEESDYRAAYRAARIEAVGYGGMASEEELVTLPF